MRRNRILAALLALALSPIAADDEAPNKPLVVAAESGYCYAKSVPSEEYGEGGTTRVFRVERSADKLLHTYRWSAQEFYVDCLWPYVQPTRVSAVQLGPWARGRQANAETLAIAFYLDGRLLKRYSTLDIAGTPTNVRRSSDHYDVFETIHGYRQGAGRMRFVVRTTDGRTLVFDTETGARVDDKVAAPPN